MTDQAGNGEQNSDDEDGADKKSVRVYPDLCTCVACHR
jgi:hypothetical protein